MCVKDLVQPNLDGGRGGETGSIEDIGNFFHPLMLQGGLDAEVGVSSCS
jgi:hypothetical protein